MSEGPHPDTPQDQGIESFNALIDQAPFGILVVDAQLRIRRVSHAVLPAFTNVQPLIGRHVADALRTVWTEPFASEAVAVFQRTLDTGEPYASPGVTEQRKDLGSAESYEWQTRRIPLPDGGHGVACYFLDTTTVQQAHSAVRESEERFREFTSATSDVVYRMSPDWSELRYLQGHEFIPNTLEPSQSWLATYVPPGDQASVTEAIERAIRGKTVFELEHRVIRADGSVGWASSRAVPILDDNGELLEWFGAASDITQRKDAESAQLRSEERYRTLFNSIDEGFCIIDMIYDDDGRPVDYRFVEVNPAFTKHTGLRDAQGRTVLELVPSQESHWFRIYGEVARTGRPMRFENRGEGMGRWFDVYAFRLGGAGSRRVAVLFNDITERRTAEEALRDADRRKDEFLAMLAHELRNPLAPIRTGLELIRLAGNNAASVERVRATMERQVGHMVRLIDDLLDVSRITSGKIQLQRTQVSLVELVNSAVDANRATFEAAHVHLHIDLQDVPCTLDADPTRLMQVLSNLLHNASKYTAPGGHVRVEAVCHPSTGGACELELRVADDGAGIAPALLPRVFDLFAQGEQPAGRKVPGLGIGLALARQLVEMHGGRIEAASDGPGRGSVFTIRLPGVRIESRGAGPLPATPLHVPTRRVVIIDDNEDAAQTLAMLVEEMGSEARVAYDGASGLKAVSEFNPDIVLLDVGMPGMDGYDTCRAIRRGARGADTFVVAVTGWGQEQDKRRALEAGFDAHLTKPADPRVLERMLAEGH